MLNISLWVVENSFQWIRKPIASMMQNITQLYKLAFWNNLYYHFRSKIECPPEAEGGKFITSNDQCEFFDPKSSPEIHCDSTEWKNAKDQQVVSILCYKQGTYIDDSIVVFYNILAILFSSISSTIYNLNLIFI